MKRLTSLPDLFIMSFLMVAWPSGKAMDCNSVIPSSNLGATFLFFNTSIPTIFMLSIVIAILAEAHPIIEHYDLKQDTAYHQQVYRNQENTIELIVTGSKIARVAAGVGAIGKKGNKWLNIGVCGHRDFSVGSIYMVSEIHFQDLIDYPIFLFKPPCPLQGVRTVMHGEREYPEDVLYEMEAYTFFKAAMVYSPPELIHLIKVVSDNKNNCLLRLDKKDFTLLIEKQMPIITKIIDEMVKLPAKEPEKDLSFYFNKWHFNEGQKKAVTKNNARERKCFYETTSQRM